MFAVVIFLDDDSVAVVPKLWLNGNGESASCAWPPYKQDSAVKRAVQKQAFPEIDWKYYDVKVLKFYGMYVHLLNFMCPVHSKLCIAFSAFNCHHVG